MMVRIERDLLKYDIAELNSEDYLFKIENGVCIEKYIVKILDYICEEENRHLFIFVPRLKILVSNLQDEFYLLENEGYHNLIAAIKKFKDY